MKFLRDIFSFIGRGEEEPYKTADVDMIYMHGSPIMSWPVEYSYDGNCGPYAFNVVNWEDDHEKGSFPFTACQPLTKGRTAESLLDAFAEKFSDVKYVTIPAGTPHREDVQYDVTPPKVRLETFSSNRM